MKKEIDKGNEPSTVRKIFQVIFIVITFLIGLSSVIMIVFCLSKGFYFGGILYILLVLFAFLPKKITRVPYWTRALIALVSFFVIITIIATAHYIPVSFIEHNMQENFSLNKGNLSMIVYNITETESVLIANRERTTDGYFLVMDCRITNFEQYAITLNMNTYWYNLIDSENKTYKGSSNLGDREIFQPSLGKNFYLLFEVPKTAQKIKLQIFQDKNTIHVVDLKI